MKIVGSTSASSKWPEFSWRKPLPPQPLTFSGAVADPTCMPQLRYEELMDFEFADVVPQADIGVGALSRVTLKANQYTTAKADRVVWEGYRHLGVFSIHSEREILQDVLYGEQPSQCMNNSTFSTKEKL